MDKLDEILYESLKEKDSPDQKINRKIISEWEKEGQTMKGLPKKKVWIRKPAAACIALLFLTTGCIAFATTHFSMWKDQEQLKEYVKSDVFQDSDQHVKVTMEELLSDAVCVQGLVRLDAKDEEGKKWLKEVVSSNFVKEKTADGSEVYFRDKSSDIFDMNLRLMLQGKSGECDIEYIKSASTDDTQYYRVYFNSSDSALPEKEAKAVFHYQLPSEVREKEIDVSCNVPVKEYNLKLASGEKISTFYTPEKIRITPLSYVIYGENQGLYESGEKSQRILLSAKEYTNEEFKTVYLLDRNMKKMDVSCNSSLGGMWKSEQESIGLDCLVASGTFIKEILPGEVEIPQIDIDSFSGIQLTNHYRTSTYKLEKIR